MNLLNRCAQLQNLFPEEPSFRWRQVITAWFNPDLSGWEDLTTLSKNLREKIMTSNVGWLSYNSAQAVVSKDGETHKALLELSDGVKIETVLMRNRREAWTICVSTQVGCAMACRFCATGTMGFKRNLLSDEIIDQYRFWMYYLVKHPELSGRISNIVVMGMGEPLANYEETKNALNIILSETELGPTNITVSTVGVLPQLEKLLSDTDWPSVRLAVSLHSADPELRAQLMPSTATGFFVKLTDWSRRYLAQHGNRRHHLTFEYVLLRGVNDRDSDAKKLANLVKKIGNVRVNLIPYNSTGDVFGKSDDSVTTNFQQILRDCGVDVTRRRSMGEDIAAACGQLVTQGKKVLS